jgi:putative FmdB family regulatory protein
MTPTYEYRCEACARRQEELRPMGVRDLPGVCLQCGHETRRILSMPHVLPDGVYSYSPNIGDPNTHERRNQIIRDKYGSDA